MAGDDPIELLRAVADRSVGFLRRQDPVIVEKTLQVRLRPPRLEVLSSQHYGRQGGSGAVVYRVGETAVSSGVRAGDHISEGSPVDGGGPGVISLSRSRISSCDSRIRLISSGICSMARLSAG